MSVKNSNDATVTANGGEHAGCTDYRKFGFAKMIFIDGALAERGASWQFMLVMMIAFGMKTCSFVSIFVSSDARNTLDYLRSGMLGVVVTVGLTLQYVSRHRIARIHAFLDEAMRKSRTGLAEEREILCKGKNDATAQLGFFMKMFTCNALAMMFTQPIVELVLGNSWKKLPIPWSFPSTETDTSFYLVFLYQIAAVIISNCTGMAIMSFISLTIQMSALFDVILLALRNIESRAAARSRTERTSHQTALTDCLSDDVSGYVELIRELRSITPYFRDIFLTVSAGVPLILACEAYPLMSGGVPVGDMMKSFVFLTLQIVCWAQLCSHFEGLTDKHFEVFNGMYETPWYEAGIEYRKMVLTTLTYATQPKYVRARLLNEVTANMATFYSFVVSAFNMLNMLRKIS